MDIDFFQQKYESKSNTELEEIARNNIKYVLFARIAAITIMKDRNFDSLYINIVEKELLNQEKKNHQKSINKELENENIFQVLNIISRKTKKYQLKNGNELQIKRLTKSKFQIRINHSKSYMSPVVICSINEEKEINYYPFIYIKSIVIALIISFTILGYFYYEYKSIPDYLIFALSAVIIFNLIIQLFLSPLIFNLILKTFKDEIKNRNVS
jgi:hypothetical protein